MAAAIPDREPETIVAGDTVKWTKSLTDYPANESWTLTYEVLHASGDLAAHVASASGANHLVTITAATTAAWNATAAKILANWTAYVTKSGERFTIGSGSFYVLPNPAVVTTLDARSHARKVLDAIQAVLEDRATVDQAGYSIAGRSLSRTPVPELLELERVYAAKVAAEERKAAVAAGRGNSGTIRTRFNS